MQQKLIRLQMLCKSLSGDEIARELINTLSYEYGIRSEQFVAVMHDCASANNVTIRTLKILFPSIISIGCFSYTLNQVGEKFNVPNVHDFTTYWITLLSNSFKAQFLWKQQIGRTVCGYSLTRWWSKWEVINQILELFGDVRSSDEFSANTRAKLIEYFENIQKRHSLKVELACVVDAGNLLFKPLINWKVMDFLQLNVMKLLVR